MMDWSNILNIIISSVFSGGIVGVITWRAALRKGNAEAKKSESEADTIDLKNAQILIDMYKKSIVDLTEAHDKQVNLLKKEYDSLVKSFDDYKAINEERLKKLHEDNEKLQTDYAKMLILVKNSCKTCKYKDECKKRAELMTM